MRKLKKGDQVTIHDGSASVRMDKYEETSSLNGSCKDQFTVVGHVYLSYTKNGFGPVNDIHIQNNKTGAIYLHTERMVTLVPKPVKPPVMLVCTLTPGCLICKCKCPCHR